jgi:hypothetical protein
MAIKPQSPDTQPLEEEGSITDYADSFSVKFGTPINLGFNNELPQGLNINKD